MNKTINSNYQAPENCTYLNTSSSGLISKTGVKKSNQFWQDLNKLSSTRAEEFLSSDLPEIRKCVADFMDASINAIALVPNFSFGLNAVIPSLRKYKNVLLLEDDYPSLTQPFHLNDFRIHNILRKADFSFSTEQIKEAIIDKNIDVLAISQVQWLTGFMIEIEDIGQFCRERGVVLIVDGTQSLGALPYSFSRSSADIFISSNYKWMNAGYGTGILAIKQKFLDEHPPKLGGYASFVTENDDWVYRPSILSYEPGHLNYSGLLVLQDAIQQKSAIGLSEIFEHNQHLVQKLIDGINPEKATIVGSHSLANRCGIICLQEEAHLIRKLSKSDIVCKSRNGLIRMGIHFYNTEQDIDRALEVINE